MSIRFTDSCHILTDEGLKSIKELKVGDMVLSKDNTYHKVLNITSPKKAETYKIKGQNFNELDVSVEQQILVRKRIRIWVEDLQKHVVIKVVQPKLMNIAELIPTDEDGISEFEEYYVGCPINQESIIPEYNGLNLGLNNIWYIIGLYLANGRLDPENSDIFIVNCDNIKLDRISSNIDMKAFNITILNKGKYSELVFEDKNLVSFISQFTKNNIQSIPNFVYNLPRNLLRSFISGCFDLVGISIKNTDDIKLVSMNKEMIQGLSLCIMKAFRRWTDITSEEINSNLFVYTLKFTNRGKIQDSKNKFYRDEKLWFPIDSIYKLDDQEEVVEIKLEGSHSAVINNCIINTKE